MGAVFKYLEDCHVEEGKLVLWVNGCQLQDLG